MSQAAAWCPDATLPTQEASAIQLAAQIAARRGLGAWLGFPAPRLPTSSERELLEAVEEMIRAARLELPNPLLNSWHHLATQAGALEPLHPLGDTLGPPAESCGSCAWSRSGRCIQTARPRRAAKTVSPDWPACIRWEARLWDTSCESCGACCREGYSLAPVRRGEAMLQAHPEWVCRSALGAYLPRPNGRCVALAGDAAMPWRCRDYSNRPRACADLAVASLACLIARRRTGQSW